MRHSSMLRARSNLALASLLVAPILVAPILACKSDEPSEQAPKLLTLDISEVDPALTGKLLIDVPPGSKSELRPDGAMSIRGPQAGVFSIVVALEPRNLDHERDGTAEIILDEPQLVITNLVISDEVSMLSFAANVTVGERTFGCFQDTAASLDRSQIDRMVAACRSLRIE